MQFSFQSTNAAGAPATVSTSLQPLNADGSVNALAVLSAEAYESSDPTVFTVSAAGVVTAVNTTADVSATFTATATFTMPDGRTGSIQGVATVSLTVAPPPPPALPTSLGITFGTPQ
jgi:hypothetical protein